MNEGREGSLRKLMNGRISNRNSVFILANDVYENVSAINEANGKQEFIVLRRVRIFMILDVNNANLLSAQEQNKNPR
jgi:hypothetical protein